MIYAKLRAKAVEHEIKNSWIITKIVSLFLNPDRGHMPDIDSDFCVTKGSLVFDHLNELYGKHNCCNIITFSNLKIKSLMKDIARVYQVPLAEVNKATSLVDKDAKTFEDLLGNPTLAEFFRKYPMIFKHGKILQNAPRHNSQHPAGICVLPFDARKLMPMQYGTPTATGNLYQLAQYQKEAVEEVGAVKLDILKLSNMTDLYNNIDLLQKYYNIEMKLTDIPLSNDKTADKTWNMICACDTLGVFQMETTAKPIIKQIKPQNIEELSAVNAFVRPGTSGLQSYVAGKQDATKIPKYHPKLDKWLATTYGGIVYQEQILGLVSELMGVSFGKADIYRRALEKPDKPKNKPLVEDFVNNAVAKGVENGIEENACKQIRDAILDNAGYLFNKSHSICYSYISYWIAWFKANYPTIFYTTALNPQEGRNAKNNKLQDFMTDARLHGVAILPPNIMTSHHSTIISDAKNNIIQIGLHSIKGIGQAAADKLVRLRGDCHTWQDLLNNKVVDKSTVEAAIQIGATEAVPLAIPMDIQQQLEEQYGIRQERIREETDENVYLTRAQQRVWWEQYQIEKAHKKTANYAVPTSIIAGKFMDEESLEGIVIEKDIIVIPETQLSSFGLSVDDVCDYKTAKRPKGKFANKKATKQDKCLTAYINAYPKIVTTRVNWVASYLQDMEQFEVSFIPHPLSGMRLKPFANVADGAETTTAGIVVEILLNHTRVNNKPYWRIILQTPEEKIRVTIWKNVYDKIKHMLYPNAIVMVSGKKGFGGITANVIKLYKLCKLDITKVVAQAMTEYATQNISRRIEEEPLRHYVSRIMRELPMQAYIGTRLQDAFGMCSDMQPSILTRRVVSDENIMNLSAVINKVCSIMSETK